MIEPTYRAYENVYVKKVLQSRREHKSSIIAALTSGSLGVVMQMDPMMVTREEAIEEQKRLNVLESLGPGSYA